MRINDARHWQMLTFIEWHYPALGWVLAAFWGVVVVAAGWAALADPDRISRRLSAALAAGLLFHIMIHVFYFATCEGVFVFTSHGLFLSAALLAPLMVRLGRLPAPWRLGRAPGPGALYRRAGLAPYRFSLRPQSPGSPPARLWRVSRHLFLPPLR
jgi:hypothetical protein